jgi:hypothetical protein
LIFAAAMMHGSVTRSQECHDPMVEYGQWQELEGQDRVEWLAYDDRTDRVLGHQGYQPAFTTVIDIMVLSRGSADRRDIIFDNASQPILSTADIDLSSNWGFSLDLIWHDPSQWDLQVTFFDTGRFGNSQLVSGTDLSYLFFGGVPAAPSDSYVAHYDSILRGGAFRARRRFNNRVTGYVGLGGMLMREHFEILEGADTTVGVRSATANNLWGLTLGSDFVAWTSGVVQVYGGVKGGVYNNYAQAASTALDAGGTSYLRSDWDENQFSCSGEATLGLKIALGPHVALRLAYRGIYLHNVALAPDQSDDLSFFSSGGAIDFTDTFYHGGYTGLEVTW